MRAPPDFPEERLRHAAALHRAGKFEEAARLLRETLGVNAGSAAAYKLLAVIERALGRRSAEAAALADLLSLEHNNADAWHRLGALKLESADPDGACQAYRRAAALAPEVCAHWEGLAASALSAQRLTVAQQASVELLKRFAQHGPSHLLAGHIHKAFGRDDAAAAAYERALALCPDHSEAIFNLVDLKTPEAGSVLGSQARRLNERQNMADPDRANLNFALGRIHEAAGDFDTAFAHYQRANTAASQAMKGRGISYAPGLAEEFFDATISAYPRNIFPQPVNSNGSEPRLIFIVGMPRSGTTLVEQILGSHPQVAAGGELTIASDCERLYTRRRTQQGLRGPIDTTDERERGLLADMRELYVDKLFERNLDAEYVTDKLPGNFTRLGFIRLVFPDAVIVHCNRHPMATCWSLFTANFASHDPYYHSLEHLAHFHGSYRKIMHHWRAAMLPAIVEFQYEEAVSKPVQAIRQLLDDVGLSWDERCLSFHENPRPVLTASYRQARMPIYASSVDRWRHFSAHLHPLAGLS